MLTPADRERRKEAQIDHCMDSLRYAIYFMDKPMPKLTLWQRFKASLKRIFPACHGKGGK